MIFVACRPAAESGVELEAINSPWCITCSLGGLVTVCRLDMHSRVTDVRHTTEPLRSTRHASRFGVSRRTWRREHDLCGPVEPLLRADAGNATWRNIVRPNDTTRICTASSRLNLVTGTSGPCIRSVEPEAWTSQSSHPFGITLGVSVPSSRSSRVTLGDIDCRELDDQPKMSERGSFVRVHGLHIGWRSRPSGWGRGLTGTDSLGFRHFRVPYRGHGPAFVRS